MTNNSWRKRVPSGVRSLVSALSAQRLRRRYTEQLDPAFYLREHPDIAQQRANPVLHFHRFGAHEDRKPNVWFSPTYIRNSQPHNSFAQQSTLEAYVNSGLAQKPRLVFVSHDASRTGAPAIILRLLEIFSQSGAFECFTILDEGGERLAEFQALSHTYVMSHSRRDPTFSGAALHSELSDLCGANGIFQSNRPVCALVNSAETYHIGGQLAQLGIPTVSLIHEIAAYYPAVVFEQIAALSDKVIFPSQFVQQAATRFSAADASKFMVRGQGVLDDEFGSLSRDQCRRLLREELDVPEEAFVVLNVGTQDSRKGVDLFVEMARIYLARNQQTRPVYFAWYGHPSDAFHYAQDFIKRHDLSEFIRLMPSTSEIEQVFLGGDLFMLTARADPFPCVVHEALACGLPAIAFRGGGGAPELIGDDCGATVDMGDLVGASALVAAYVDDPDLWQKHSENGIAKIREHWRFADYHRDIYTTMQQSCPPPPQGWPPIPYQQPPKRLAIMPATQEALKLVLKEHKSGGENGAISEVALIDGRFGDDIQKVADQLSVQGIGFKIYQPTDDTHAARSALVQQLLRKPRPKSVVLVNSLAYVTPAMLKPLNYPKVAIQTQPDLSDSALYLLLPHLSKLVVAKPDHVARLVALNPAVAARVLSLG